METHTPFVIRFKDGYHAIKLCMSAEHALDRAKQVHPSRNVDNIIDLDLSPHGWYQKNKVS